MGRRLVTPCVVVLAGPSGAGKSTWAREHFAANEIVSSDALRATVGVGHYDQKASKDAFDLLDRIVAARVRRSLTTVVDTVGLDDERRRELVALARAHGLPVYAVGFDTPPQVCRARNRQRSRPVPPRVLTSQIERWQVIRSRLPDEGFDDVILVDGSDDPAPHVGPDPASIASAAAARQQDAPCDDHSRPIGCGQDERARGVDDMTETARKILVALDTSEIAERGIPYAVSLAKVYDAEIVLFTCLDEPVRHALEEFAAIERVTMDAAASTYLQRVQARLEEMGITTSFAEQEAADAADGITAYAAANGVDLIVMTTHGRSGLGRQIMGSITDDVLRKTGVPVYVVPARAAG